MLIPTPEVQTQNAIRALAGKNTGHPPRLSEIRVVHRIRGVGSQILELDPLGPKMRHHSVLQPHPAVVGSDREPHRSRIGQFLFGGGGGFSGGGGFGGHVWCWRGTGLFDEFPDGGKGFAERREGFLVSRTPHPDGVRDIGIPDGIVLRELGHQKGLVADLGKNHFNDLEVPPGHRENMRRPVPEVGVDVPAPEAVEPDPVTGQNLQGVPAGGLPFPSR